MRESIRSVSVRWVGAFQMVSSGICFGFLGYLGKSVYAAGVTPGELLSLRFTLASVTVLTFLLVTRPNSLQISRKSLLTCALLGACGYAVFSFCFFSALKSLSASLTVLLLYTYPVLVSFGAWIFLGEAITKKIMFILPVVMVGLVMLIGVDFRVERIQGLLFGIGAALIYSGYILVSRRLLRGVDSLVAAAFIQASAALVLSMIHIRSLDRVLNVMINAWLPLLAIALIATVAAMSLFLSGLKKLKTSDASILSLSEPITGVFVAFLLLNESLTFLQFMGGVTILSGLIVTSKNRSGTAKV